MENKRKNSFKLIMMIVLTLITQVFILIRVSIMASKFGVSQELDAFNFANSIATLMFSFISTGITTILIPNLGDKLKKKSIDSFITILYIIATAMLGIGIVFRETIIKCLSENNNSEFIQIGTTILIISLIAQYVMSFIGLSNAVLQAQNKFNRSKMVILIVNVLTIIIIVLQDNLNIYDYAKAILITSIINVILQFIFMFHSGFRFKINLDTKDETFKTMMKSFGPIILSTGLYQISLMIDTTIASGLGEGTISILNYSNYVIGMINMLLIVNITSFLFPKIAQNIKSKSSQEYLANYIVMINVIMSLIVAGFIIVGYDALEILYMRGEFQQKIVEVVYLCTVGYIVAIPLSASRDILYKYFYANNDTKTPFKNSVLISIINIVISVILAKFIGIYGVVLGTSIASIFSLSFIGIRFKRKFGFKFNKKALLIDNIKILVATIISIIVTGLLRSNINLNNNFAEVIIFGTSIVLIYVGVLYILKSRIFKMKI